MTSEPLLRDASADRWLRRFQNRPDPLVRLVCLPDAGCAANSYRNWHRHLPGWVEVAAVQYPGRQDRRTERCMERLPAIAAEVTAAIMAEEDVPLTLFGHGMGALVAYETAVRLQRRGRPVRRLIVSGHPAPSRCRTTAVRRSPDVEPTAARADHRAALAYRPSVAPLLRCPITSYYGLGDPDVNEGDAGTWYEVTEGRFQLCGHPGDHFYLVPRERQLVTEIGARLTPDQA